MVKAFLAVAAVLAVVAAASASSNPNCDPTYECQYKYTTPDLSASYTFDFSSLCASTDFMLTDQAEHTYYANVCGTAAHNCLPATWSNTYEFGVAVQFWGATPACGNPPACKDKQNTAKCCTADCQVLGTGAPMWSLLDPTNPTTGGVKARFLGAAASDSDPFWCTFNPSTGAQYEREVHFNFNCDESVDGITPLEAVQNSTNDCRYMLEFATSKACAGGSGSDGLSGGWIFIIILVCVAFVYIVGGMGYNYYTKQRLEFPNVELWATFADLVRDGFLFVGHGFKKQGGSLAGAGSYDDIAGPSNTGGAKASYTASGTAGAGDEPYTDL